MALNCFRPGLKGRLASSAAVIELFAAVCLIDNPTNCKDVSLIYSAEALTPMQCLMQAQPEVAKWIGEHPGSKWITLARGRIIPVSVRRRP